jgi:glycolate dehydrogenase FAD-binding subunit
MTASVADRLRLLLGEAAVQTPSAGPPRAAPADDEALALLCETARREGWRIRIEGGASWLPDDAPAEVVLSTARLDRIVSVSPSDLVATVQAGVPLDRFQSELARQGMWLALDPPGAAQRSIGSIVATGTAGALRHGLGPVRDHVLGCTVSTGDGRLVKAGGRVVKNVAGYDLTKLHVGGFGGFGVLTALNLRLRARPEHDLTMIARGTMAQLLDAGQALLNPPVGVALELLSPELAGTSDWVLAARMQGTRAGVEAEAGRLAPATGRLWEQVPADQAPRFWSGQAASHVRHPVSFRAGVVLDGIEAALELLLAAVGPGMLSSGLGTGSIRWSGSTGAEPLRRLRQQAAAREIPLTLERAPWPVRTAVGHFGAYREGVGPLVDQLRRAFDPARTLAVALGEPAE